MDLRGHGLSDAPTEDPTATTTCRPSPATSSRSRKARGCWSSPTTGSSSRATGSGRSSRPRRRPPSDPRCAGLVLVDGGWEDARGDQRMDVDEFLRGLDEPPEVLRSMRAFLADRAAFDPATWDADQERAARATVVETHAGQVVPATRPHALEACVRAMFAYDPLATLADGRGAGRGAGRGRRRDGSRAAALAEVVGAPAARRAAADRRHVVPPRRPQPDALPSGRGRPPRSCGRQRRLAVARIAPMQVVYSPAHLAPRHHARDVHGRGDPGQRGRRAGRADPRRARGRRRLRAVAPTEHGEAPITAVHDPGLVRFLEVAWSRASARRGSTRPFLSADTYPNRAMFEGMSAEASGGSSASRAAIGGRAGFWGLDSADPARRRDVRRGPRRRSTSR